MTTTVRKSIGTKAAYTTGTIAIDATGLIVTISGGTWAANQGEGDAIVIDNGGTPETCYVLSRGSASQLTLQTASTHAGLSGLNFSIARAYSTISLWEAGTQGNLVSADQIQKGVAYKESIFAEYFAVAGSTCDATRYRHLTSAVVDRHTGISGTGVIIRKEATWLVVQVQEDYFRMSWIEIDGVEIYSSGGNYGFITYSATYNQATIHHCIIKNFWGGICSYSSIILAFRNIVYSSHYPFYMLGGVPTLLINNTFYAVDYSTYAGFAFWVTSTSYKTHYYVNNLTWVVSILGGACNRWGTDPLFQNGMIYNILSSDATAGTAPTPAYGNTGHVVNQSGNPQFVSIVGGSEDLHLLATATALKAGYDASALAVSLDSDIAVGIDGNTVSGTWDIGADQHTVPVSGAPVAMILNNWGGM